MEELPVMSRGLLVLTYSVMKFQPILYWTSDYLSTILLKLNHASHKCTSSTNFDILAVVYQSYQLMQANA